MTVRTPVITTFLKEYQSPFVPFSNYQRLQVFDNISALPFSKRHHYAIFVRSPPMLVVWDEEPVQIIDRAERIERHLVNMLWSMESSDDEYSPPTMNAIEEKVAEGETAIEAETKEVESSSQEGEEAMAPRPRRPYLYQSLLVACAAILTIFCLSVGWRRIVQEILIDHTYQRLAILIAAPLQLWLSFFFFMAIVNGVSQMFGPVRQVTRNSKFYSALPPQRIKGTRLPHVTIQCPVYKEGLEGVIHPTVQSLMKAISTYELQGGTAAIFINDDGMQVIPEEEARKRMYFYEENNLGFVARPPHAPKGDANGENVFVRAGKFKKASNMNYCLNVSNRVEDKMAKVERTRRWNQADEDRLYQHAFEEVLKEDEGRTWGGGNIRIGDFILLVDSDTRVPEDCLLDAVSEMEESPDVAIIQFSSGVLNVTTSFFERAITFFTNLVYTAIKVAVANGDVPPFVGHNALLRWSAIQNVRYIGKDGTQKFWAENTVSEDFDLALRLQALGYFLRYSTYMADGFKEGVSLTVYDELSRWTKYAYGCAELLFNPFYYWPTRGPFTPLFRRFMGGSMNITGKMTICAYIGTYFAIASAWPLTLMNYFLIGWYNGHFDQAYLTSFNVYFGIVIVFQGLGTLPLAILRYRIENRSLLGSLVENCTWLPIMTIFLGGLSLHVSQAILCYLFSIDMTWGATAKEAESTSFFREIPFILKRFKYTFLFCISMTTMMIILAGVGPLGQMIPHDWRIGGFTAIFPLAIVVGFHFASPLVLNPGLMQFTF